MGLNKKQTDLLLKKYPKAKKIAVENFLMTKTDNEFADSINMHEDAKMYNWNTDTISAIKEGIKMR